MNLRKFLLLFVLLVASGYVAAVYLVPWNSILERRITAFMQSRGFEDVTFKIDNVGIHQATLNNIVVGKENPLLLQSVTVKYKPKELIEGNLQDLTLNGLDIQILQTDAGWTIAGLESLQRPSTDDKRPAPALSDLIDILPFSSVTIADSHLRITGKNIWTSLPFMMRIIKAPQTEIDMTINASNLVSKESEIALGIVTLKAKPDEKRNWNGTWSLESMDAGKILPVPVLSGGGAVNYTGNVVTLDGNLSSVDKLYAASFKSLFDINASNKSLLTITSMTFPFKEGTLSSKNIVIPLERTKNITVRLDIHQVSMDALLQTLTGKRVTATGTVSGSVPIIIKPDNSYSLGKGSLKANSTGLIQMSGDAIPGDNEQIAMVRQVLENLHYSVFSAAVDTSGGQGMVVRLSLEGNNPEVYDGRIVKLNVNLTGDVLDFIQQNAMLITNPEKLLEQGKE